MRWPTHRAPGTTTARPRRAPHRGPRTEPRPAPAPRASAPSETLFSANEIDVNTNGMWCSPARTRPPIDPATRISRQCIALLIDIFRYLLIVVLSVRSVRWWLFAAEGNLPAIGDPTERHLMRGHLPSNEVTAEDYAPIYLDTKSRLEQVFGARDERHWPPGEQTCSRCYSVTPALAGLPTA